MLYFSLFLKYVLAVNLALPLSQEPYCLVKLLGENNL